MRNRIHLSIVCVLATLSFASAVAHNETQRSAPIVFEDSGLNLGTGGACFSVALGDVDGDNDLDAFVAQYENSSRLWLNDGTGLYTQSGQTFGSTSGHGAALGDLDGDGDLDLFLVFLEAQDRVYMNNGSGIFTDSGQRLGSPTDVGIAVRLGDIEGDGDLDALVENNGAPNAIWKRRSKRLGSAWSGRRFTTASPNRRSTSRAMSRPSARRSGFGERSSCAKSLPSRGRSMIKRAAGAQ